MSNFLHTQQQRWVAIIIAILTCSGLAVGQTQYLLTNDDVVFPFLTGVSVYTVNSSGNLNLKQQVLTGGHGIGGGYFGANRIVVLDGSTQQCAYASEGYNGDVVGIDMKTFTLGGSASGSSGDHGTSNGIGLVIGGNYLYASFTDSNTIGMFAIEPGCGLTFISDTAVSGLQGGVINAMAAHGSILIVTFTDGSIQSFDISGGTPVSNGDEQLSTATTSSQGSTYANAIDITSDGHYALFGDTSTSAVVEVSDISSGKLNPTSVYKYPIGINSSNIILSPDETILYVVNTQGDAVAAYFFNATTGVLTRGCESKAISGLSSNWSYLATARLISQTGNGNGLYVAEFGAISGIAKVQLSLSNGTCTLLEAAGSPFADPNSTALLSIATYPPRSF